VRYYAPWLGRWTSADPIGLGDGVNRFVYCHCHPATGSDTTGLAEPAEDHGTTSSGVVWPPPDGLPSSMRTDALTGYFDSPLAKDIVRQYVANDDPDLVVTLGNQQTKDLGLVLLGPRELSIEAAGLRPDTGARTEHVELDSGFLGYAAVPGTLGPFAGHLSGGLTSRSDGSFVFHGDMTVDESIDYTVGNSGRPVPVDAILLAAQPFLAGGTPYRLRTPPIPVTMTYAPGLGWNITSQSPLVDTSYSARGDVPITQQYADTMRALPRVPSPYFTAAKVALGGAAVGAIGAGLLTKNAKIAAMAGVAGGIVATPVAGVIFEWGDGK